MFAAAREAGRFRWLGPWQVEQSAFEFGGQNAFGGAADIAFIKLPITHQLREHDVNAIIGKLQIDARFQAHDRRLSFILGNAMQAVNAAYIIPIGDDIPVKAPIIAQQI